MQFGIFTTSADYPNQPTLDALSPDLIGAFATVSASFLHEYTHLVGRGSKLSIMASDTHFLIPFISLRECREPHPRCQFLP
jgi:hypothetical protein